MEALCKTCDKRGKCSKPCKAVDAILWEDNRIMERHYMDHIVCYPKNEEVHYSELSEKALDGLDIAPGIPWSSGESRLRKTTVFIERFFNKTPCKELAKRFGVRENTIVCMYRDAVAQILRIIKALDARREGMKQVQTDRFTDEEKMFLLVYVFGYTNTEVGLLFDLDHRKVSAKLKPMADRFSEIFASRKKKSIYDGLSKEQMKDRILGR